MINMENEKKYGVTLERGIITAARENTPYREYKVKSLERPGIESPWIKSILPIVPYHAKYLNELAWEDQYLPATEDMFEPDEDKKIFRKSLVYYIKYNVGEKVIFFLFDDGTGKIVSRMD